MHREVEYDSEEYWQTISLRSEILRKPLGIEVTEEEINLDKDSHHLTLWEDESLLACLILTPQPENRFRMRQLAVAENYQGKGYGTSLVQHSEAYARDNGGREIFAHARESALAFYKKSGYEVTGDPFMEVNLRHYRVTKRL